MNNGTGGFGTVATSVLNSATGTGPVVVNAGGTFGGSKVGGAVGMPGTGPVTINNGGYLLPGGGYFNDSSGQGSPSYAFQGNNSLGGSETVAIAVDPNFNPTLGPALRVLGNLNLNNGANVNFNFGQTGSDGINIGGAFNLTGTVNVSLNAVGLSTPIDNYVPLFSGFSAFTVNGGTVANNTTISDVTLIGANGTSIAGDSLKLSGNKVFLIAPAGAPELLWGGSIAISGSYMWDTTTQNFLGAGTALAFTGSQKVTFDDTAANTIVTITGSGVSPANVTFNNNQKTYTLQGGPITGNTAVNVVGGGTVIFSGSNNTYGGGTNLQGGSTLQVNNPSALSSNNLVNIYDHSTLSLNYTDNGSGTYGGTINLQGGSDSSGATPRINIPSGTVTLSGAIASQMASGVPIGLTKTGAGTLVLTNAAISTDTGANVINAGFVQVNATYGADAGASYSALGSGPLYVGPAGTGGGLWLNNVQVGIDQNQTKTDLLGQFYMYTGGTLQGTGDSSLARTNLEAYLNFTGGTAGYSPGVFTLSTVSKTDVLALKDAVDQFDPNYQVNNYVNYIPGSGTAATATANYNVTANVQGPGTVMLQSGGISSNGVFGGSWVVGGSGNSGNLQLGPFAGTNSASSGTLAGNSSGPGGEIFNALGFKTAYNAGSTTTTSGNPDLPNAVTVNAGGMLTIANDQINANAVAGLNNPVNPTPAYFRNPITLSGGTLAATGAEVTFNTLTSSTSGQQAWITQSNSAVVARLGGNFALTAGTASTILTYDPNGMALDSTGSAIAADGITRTVEIVGGSRTLSTRCRRHRGPHHVDLYDELGGQPGDCLQQGSVAPSTLSAAAARSALPRAQR